MNSPRGRGRASTWLKATVQVDRARQALLIAQNDQRPTLLALLNAIGADEGSDVTLVEPLPPAPSAPPVDAALATRARGRIK